MVDVPFQHHARKPTIFDDKLAPNLEEKVAEKNVVEKKVDEWWKSIAVPWRGFRVLIIRHGELKGRTAIVRDVAFGRKSLSGLEIFVELEVFGSMKRWIEYEQAVEER
jgi:hypothetical protein